MKIEDFENWTLSEHIADRRDRMRTTYNLPNELVVDQGIRWTVT